MVKLLIEEPYSLILPANLLYGSLTQINSLRKKYQNMGILVYGYILFVKLCLVMLSGMVLGNVSCTRIQQQCTDAPHAVPRICKGPHSTTCAVCSQLLLNTTTWLTRRMKCVATGARSGCIIHDFRMHESGMSLV